MTASTPSFRRLHIRALLAAAVVVVPFLALFASQSWAAADWRAITLRGLVAVTLPATVVAGDLALLRVSEGRPSQVTLGVAVSINVLLVAWIGLVAVVPVYGVPLIIGLAVRVWPLALLLAGSFSRIRLLQSVFAAHRELAALGHVDGWVLGLAALPLALLIGFSPALASGYVNWHPSVAPIAPAIRAAWSIEACARRYAQAHVGHPPESLRELGPSGDNCLSAVFADRQLAGWRMFFSGDAHERVIVRERGHALAMYRSFFIDRSGTLRFRGYAWHDADARDPAIASAPTQLQTIRECMNRARHVGSGQLPPSLRSMSFSRWSCSVLDNATWKVGGDSNVAEQRVRFSDGGSSVEEIYRYIYRPWTAPDGRVDSAVVSARPAKYGATGLRSYVLTSAGDVRATGEDRPADEHDPLVLLCENTGTHECRTNLPWRVGSVADTTSFTSLIHVTPIWQATLAPRPRGGTFYTPPAPLVTRDDVVVATGQMGTFAVDAAGKILWARRDIVLIQPGSLIAPNGVVVIDSSAVLHSLDREGRDSWSAPLGVKSWLAPVLSRDVIFATGDRVLVAFSIGGVRLWSKAIDGLVESLAAADDGGVYVWISDSRRIEHFNPTGTRDDVAPGDALHRCTGDSPGVSLSACFGSFHARLDSRGGIRFVAVHDLATDRTREQLVRASQTGAQGAYILDAGDLRAIGQDDSLRWRIRPSSEELPWNDPSGPVVTPRGDIARVARRYLGGAHRNLLLGYDADGDPRWITELAPEAAYSRPAIGRDAMLYLVDTRWILTAITAPR